MWIKAKQSLPMTGAFVRCRNKNDKLIVTVYGKNHFITDNEFDAPVIWTYDGIEALNNLKAHAQEFNKFQVVSVVDINKYKQQKILVQDILNVVSEVDTCLTGYGVYLTKEARQRILSSLGVINNKLKKCSTLDCTKVIEKYDV